MNHSRRFFLLAVLSVTPGLPGRTFTLQSPNGRNEVRIDVGNGIQFSVFHRGRIVLESPALSLALEDGRVLGADPRVARHEHTAADETYRAPFYAKRQRIRDHHRQFELAFEGGYGLIFRAYEDGIAYRWWTSLDGTIKILREEAGFRFPGDPVAYLPTADCGSQEKRGRDCFHSSYEEVYSVLPLSKFRKGQLAFLPVLVAPDGSPKVLITEANLADYPGMWLTGSADGSAAMAAQFPAYPLRERIVGDKFPQRVVVERAGYIAVTEGRRSYPWRVMVIAKTDGALIETDIVYRLGGETEPGDWSWLRPGKSQSEWLHDNKLYGVDFQAGYNTETYKFYADFAARFELGYLFLDAGWSEVTDLFKLTPGMDIEAIIRHARSKGLGVVLWTSSVAMETQMSAALDKFREWGVKGIMVDFMDRDDQKMVNFYERVAREAARRRMFVNFHGAFKPTGMEKKYPNVITREAVMASEYFKWTDALTPEHEMAAPFIRMVAGALDYEPGHMRNAQKEDFRAISGAPMSMGTRVRQVAMYVVYESPYAKMGGNVADYLREPEITGFIAGIPTVWEETRALEARVADYAVVLRKAANGESYVGAMTDWTPREIELDCGFLDEGDHGLEIYQDGINAAQYGVDYSRRVREVGRGDKVKIKMAPGGGWVGRFFQKGG